MWITLSERDGWYSSLNNMERRGVTSITLSEWDSGHSWREVD
ncbi:hypothetical protein [Cohnella herbarum]|nr:hypothetical protein [Cohnella herbarum]